MDPNAPDAGIDSDSDMDMDSDSDVTALDSHSVFGGPADIAIDCATCPVRAIACDDCVVSVLLGPPQFDQEAADALVVLADRGLVPPLRDPRDSRSRTAG